MAADGFTVTVVYAGRSADAEAAVSEIGPTGWPGPAEAFTPARHAALYDTNVLGAQRVNRKLLPAVRERGDGLAVWVGSSSTRGGTPPYLAPYFAAKAAMDALAASYALEPARFGIETSIVVPGAFTSGTNHFAQSGPRPTPRWPPSTRRGTRAS